MTDVFAGAKKKRPPARAAKAAPPAKPAPDLAYFSTRIPQEQHQALKLLAVKERTSVQALTEEALNLLFDKHK